MNQPSLEDEMGRLAAADRIDERALADQIAAVAAEVIAEITGGPSPVATTAAVATRRRRPRWAVVAAAACAAVVLSIVVVVGILPGTSEPAYAISVDHGVVVVNWMRDLRDGAAIGKDLRSYGVDATVRAVPASPSLVGRVLTVAVNGVDAGTMPPGVSWGADGTDDVFTWRIDPSRFKESIEIELGVEAKEDEPYVAAESAFAPGEVLGGLQCALSEPISAAEVAKQLRRLHLDAEWLRIAPAPGSHGGDRSEDLPSRTVPTGTVVNVQPIDRGTVRVSVAPPGAPLDQPIFTPVRPSAACTPELASRWIGVL